VRLVSEFLTWVTAFQEAVRHHDDDAVQRDLTQLREGFGQASDEDNDIAAGLLADVLFDVPSGRDAVVAVLIAACVERGADPTACAQPILERARVAIQGAWDFCDRWPLVEGGVYPQQSGETPPEELYEPLGGIDDPGARAAVIGWWTLPMWQSAVVAVLSQKEPRKQLLPDDELLQEARDITAVSGVGTFLAQSLAVLDDAKLVVIHRPTLEGFELVMSGVADNFQLETLLAGRLVTPGHLPGVAPSPEAVAACLADPGAPIEYDGTGSFDLVAPDGTAIRNEGWPCDIPVVEASRLLILDPASYERTWHASRAFMGMSAQLDIERRISEDGVKRWMSHVQPAHNAFPTEAAEPTEHQKRHWWRRHEHRPDHRHVAGH
jgi:hypothetical protein